MFARASAFAEIIELLDKTKLKVSIESLRKNLEAPEKNFHIGGANVKTPTLTK